MGGAGKEMSVSDSNGNNVRRQGRGGKPPRRVSSRPSHRRVAKRSSLVQKVKPFCFVCVGAWFLTVLLLRVINPPVTSLVIVRQLQSLVSSHVGVREWRSIRLRDLPIHVSQAIVTAEDARFMNHFGVDLWAVGDAIDSSGGRKRLRGASTITMQTVKNIFLWPGRSYVRKAIEWAMAPIAGIVWGKRRTLELYVNVIEWGEGIYGIESAARHYYHKSATALTPHEAAALAAILPNPRKLSPLSMAPSTKRRYVRIMREYNSTRVP